MPYVASGEQDDEDKKDKTQVSGTEATAADAGGGPGTQNLPSPQQSGLSGWTDFKAYLDANKDQSTDLAKTVAGGLAGEGEKLKGDIAAGEGNFQKTVDENAINFDPNFVDSALAKPEDFVKDDANVAKFTKMRDASYGGPNNLTDTGDYGTLQGKIQSQVARGGLIDTSGGREQLLYERGTNPTKGQVTLDSALMSGSPETRDILKAGTAKFGDLQGYLDEQNKTAGDYATTAKANTAATSAATKEKVNAAIPAYQRDLDSRLAAARQTALDRAAAAKDALTPANLSETRDPRNAALLSDLGASDEDLNSLANDKGVLDQYGQIVDPVTGKPFFQGSYDARDFVTQRNPEAEITRGNFATPEDYARAAALGKLSGQDLNGILDQNNAGTAGSANLDVLDFDRGAALDSSHGLVKDRDNYIVKQAFDIDASNAAQKVKELQGYFDNIMSGNTIPFNNPQDPRTIRQMAAIKALIRQGLYTPQPLTPDPTTGNKTFGPVFRAGGGSFTDPNTGAKVS